MPMIEVELDDDVAGVKEYTVAFVMTSGPVTQTWNQPAEGAEFEVKLVWDAAGAKVTHGEFDAVAEHVLDCHYDQMLEEATQR